VRRGSCDGVVPVIVASDLGDERPLQCVATSMPAILPSHVSTGKSDVPPRTISSVVMRIPSASVPSHVPTTLRGCPA
jgi:hypothetical protein